MKTHKQIHAAAQGLARIIEVAETTGEQSDRCERDLQVAATALAWALGYSTPGDDLSGPKAIFAILDQASGVYQQERQGEAERN